MNAESNSRCKYFTRGLALLLTLLAHSGWAIEQNKYALLIGIDEYLSADLINQPLKYAIKDAETLQDPLEERGWDATVVVDEAATRKRIIRELYHLSLKAGENDKVLIYFAGHGVRDPQGRGNTYWLTYDAAPDALISDGIRLNHILEYVNEIPAKEKIVLLDHCYSGDIQLVGGDGSGARDTVGTPSIVPARDLFPVDIEELEDIEEERLVVLAAARGPAYEHDDWGHGMFTKAILDTLDDPEADTSNDGKLSLGEFWTSVSDSISSMAEDKNLQQRPLSNNISLEQLSWVLFNAAIENAATEAEALRTVVFRLDLVAQLDFSVKMACLQVIADWEESTLSGLEQSTETLEVVRELRNIRDLGATVSSALLKQVLEQKVRALGLVEGGT